MVRLSQIAELSLGKMLDKDKNKGALRPYLANINVQWDRFNLQDLREMRFEDREIERYCLRSGDIVMCEGGEPGRCAIWQGEKSGMMIQKALHRIRPTDGIDSHFLYYALAQKGISGAFAEHLTGGGIKHLPGERLAKVEVPIPPLDEQRRIAEVLRWVDECLKLTSAEIGQLERVRFGTVARAFQDVGSSSLPKNKAMDGWTRIRLHEVFRERKERGQPGLPLASIGIEAGLVLRSSLERRVETKLGEDEHALVRAGDIAYNMMRMWQGACGLAKSDCLVSPAYVVMKPSHRLNASFALFMLRSPSVVRLLHAYSQGIVDDRLRLYPDAFGQIPVNLPPVRLQSEIVEELSNIDESLECAKQARDQLDAFRSAMLGDLLSGRVRVPA